MSSSSKNTAAELSLRRSDVRPTTTREMIGTPQSAASAVGVSPSSSAKDNDDEEERREARRRTLQSSVITETSAIEDSETLKKCLEMYNGNKLSRENAWSMSVIDTLSALLSRHHKTLNNFKVAGSSLEASSKVYGLRVDSIHTDVLRMTAGLNARKFAERNYGSDDERDGDDGGEEGGAKGTEGGGGGEAPKRARPQRARRQLCTVTKNKETLNARLDTVPLQDPVFGRLNTIIGSINSSNRLMNNILPTVDSELRLCTSYPYWDGPTPQPAVDFSAQPSYAGVEYAPAHRPLQLATLVERLDLRPLHSGYVLSDTPDVMEADDGEEVALPPPPPPNLNQMADEMAMAFDLNAECEPLPEMEAPSIVMDVNFDDYEDLSTEERTAIANCRGLRKTQIIIEDLRPIDATSQLEYSYRPLDKISQFWAGPAHWKFKRSITRPSTLGGNGSARGSTIAGAGSTAGAPRRATQAASKKRSRKLNFGEFHDNLFVKVIDKENKTRRANIQKKWDPRKLKLPTDLKVDTQMFDHFSYAPGQLLVPKQPPAPPATATSTVPDGDEETVAPPNEDAALADDGHFGDDAGPADDAVDASFGRNSFNMNGSLPGAPADADAMDAAVDGLPLTGGCDMTVIDPNDTVLEIATHYDGAPTQVTKIVVPFAKRAKVIDMKNLKRASATLISKKIQDSAAAGATAEPEAAGGSGKKTTDHCKPGKTTFNEVYDDLPTLLTKPQTESLSTAVAFYSILHLANEHGLQLQQQKDLQDLIIRQVDSEVDSSDYESTEEDSSSSSQADVRPKQTSETRHVIEETQSQMEASTLEATTLEATTLDVTTLEGEGPDGAKIVEEGVQNMSIDEHIDSARAMAKDDQTDEQATGGQQ